MSFEDKKTNKKHCCVSGCSSNYGESSSLHRFPLRDKNLYGQWLRKLNIRKPTREMYVCSRHFSENDFFCGWLAVEPNKRRLRRGVIPSRELPKSKIVEKKTWLTTSDFAASLNLKPTEKNVTQASQETCNKTKENEAKLEKQDSLKRIVDDFKAPSTSSDNLLVLKRVGEIKEAPEYQAKKKHDAQIQMRKMREYRKMQNKLSVTKIHHQIKKLTPESRRVNVNIPKKATQSQLNSSSVESITVNKGIVQDSQQLATGKKENVSERATKTIKYRNIAPKIPQLQLEHASPLNDQNRQIQTLEKLSPEAQINSNLQSIFQSPNKLTNNTLQGHVYVSQQSQQPKLRVLSAAELDGMQKTQKTIVVGSSQSHTVRTVPVLSPVTNEKIKNSNVRIKNIRVYSNDQRNKIEDKQAFLLNGEMELQTEKKLECIPIQQKINYQPLIKNGNQSIQNSKMPENNLPTNKTKDNNGMLGSKTYKPWNDNITFPVDSFDTRLDEQDITEKFRKITNLMSDTIGYVDEAMQTLDKKQQKINEQLGTATASHTSQKKRNMPQTVNNLERMIGILYSEISDKSFAIPPEFETKCTQTDFKEVENESIQINNQWNHEKLAKTKQENRELKVEIAVLKERISDLERYIQNNKDNELCNFKPL